MLAQKILELARKCAPFQMEIISSSAEACVLPESCTCSFEFSIAVPETCESYEKNMP